jgi:hypothetical protein
MGNLLCTRAEPFADIGPEESKIPAHSETRQRLAAVTSTLAAFLVDPANANLEPLGEFVWRQNILRINPAFHVYLATTLQRAP